MHVCACVLPPHHPFHSHESWLLHECGESETHLLLLPHATNPLYLVSLPFRSQEPWLLHDFREDFYDEELRLVRARVHVYPFLILPLHPALHSQEPWLLHDFGEDFYDEELRLVVVGYIRPEADFPSLPALIARIHEDGNIARTALDSAPFALFKEDPFLTEG
ncbi:unnamed protein product [Closterium sp. NIES-54]